jgi:hypothetical protein
MSRVFASKADQLWAERIAPPGQAHFRGGASLATGILARWATSRHSESAR